MNVGRDERVRPADSLGPMAALPTSTLQTVMPANHSVGPVPTRWVSPACLSCISWPPFLSPRRAIDCITHAEPPKDCAKVLVFTPRPAPPPPVPPCGRDTLLGGIVLGRHERFTNRFIGGRSLHGQPHGGVVWRATTACTASWSPACAPVVGVVIAAGFLPHKAGVNPWCLHARSRPTPHVTPPAARLPLASRALLRMRKNVRLFACTFLFACGGVRV